MAITENNIQAASVSFISRRFPSSSRAPTWISAFHCTPKQTKLHQFRSLDNIQETDTKQETDNKKARPFVRTKAFVNFKSKNCTKGQLFC